MITTTCEATGLTTTSVAAPGDDTVTLTVATREGGVTVTISETAAHMLHGQLGTALSLPCRPFARLETRTA